ncbi:MAG: PA2779 family protein [Terracidiphilus sp.]
MRFSFWRFVRSLVAAVLVPAFIVPENLVAQEFVAQAPQHLVSPTDLQNAAIDASRARQQNVDTLDRFLSSDQARQALVKARMNPEEVKKAVAGLSDQELATLATRAQRAQADFAAGNMSDRDLLIILVCIAALILIIVAVR